MDFQCLLLNDMLCFYGRISLELKKLLIYDVESMPRSWFLVSAGSKRSMPRQVARVSRAWV